MFSLINQADKLIDFSRYIRFARTIQKLLDILLLTSAFVGAYLLRFEFLLNNKNKESLLLQLLIIIPIKVLLLHLSGIYRIIWRYIGIPEMLRVFYCLAGTSLFLLAGRILLAGYFQVLTVPFSIIIFDFVLSTIFLMGVRVFRRISYEESQ
jgi:FlaA1/EpsC-like NDP-sugar epimerase